VRLGEEVFHPKYGRGTVKLVVRKPSGMFVKVDFGFAKPMLPVEELSKTPGGPPQGSEVAQPDSREILEPGAPVPVLDEVNLQARQGINALKLGQILEAQIHALSVGTENIEKEFEKVIQRVIRGKTVFLLIEGAWGSGKTHALTLLQAMARNCQLATAGAIMDGHSVSLAKPMELMREIISTMKFPLGGPQDGVITWLRRAMHQRKLRELEYKGAPLISHALSALPHGALDDPEVSQLIEDYFALALSTTETRSALARFRFRVHNLPTLRAYRLAERSRAFRELLANWAHFAKVMDATGLLVILDELDVEYSYTSWRNQYCQRLRERRHDLLTELSNLRRAPLLVAFASVPGSEMADAGEHLRQVFQNRLIEIIVPIPSREQMHRLFSQILELYEKAYEPSSLVLSKQDQSLLFDRLWVRYTRDPDPVPRKFVRLSLELFDLLFIGTELNLILQAI